MVEKRDPVREFESHICDLIERFRRRNPPGQVFPGPGMPVFRSFNSSLVRQNFVPQAISPIRKTRKMPKVMRKIAPSNIPSRQHSI